MFAHGVGEQKRNYADDARRHLTEGLKERRATLYSASVHWAPLADKLQRAFLTDVERLGSRGNMTQRLTIGTLADALAYQSNEDLKEQIFARIDEQYLRLRSDDVHLIGHSLGGLILTDWLKSRPRARVKSLQTLGCNIGLFSLGKRFVCPTQLRARGQWNNWFYPSDLLGFPLAIAPELAHVVDHALPSAGFFRASTFVPGLRHLDYWTDKQLWRRTLPGLVA